MYHFTTLTVAGEIVVVVAANPENLASFISPKKKLSHFF